MMMTRRRRRRRSRRRRRRRRVITRGWMGKTTRRRGMIIQIQIQIQKTFLFN
jgi:hypothetical protein